VIDIQSILLALTQIAPVSHQNDLTEAKRTLQHRDETIEMSTDPIFVLPLITVWLNVSSAGLAAA
jgi:hypothetical protein